MKWMNYDCIIRNGRNENTKRYNEWKERGFFFFSFGRYFIYCYAMYMIYVFGKIQRSGNLNDNFQFINANIRL